MHETEHVLLWLEIGSRANSWCQVRRKESICKGGLCCCNLLLYSGISLNQNIWHTCGLIIQNASHWRCVVLKYHAQETWKAGLHLALAWDGRAIQPMLTEPAESIYRCPNKPWDTYFLPMVNAGNGDRPKWCHLVREPEPMLAAAGRRGASSV